MNNLIESDNGLAVISRESKIYIRFYPKSVSDNDFYTKAKHIGFRYIPSENCFEIPLSSIDKELLKMLIKKFNSTISIDSNRCIAVIRDKIAERKDLFENIARKKIPFWDRLFQHQKDGAFFASHRKYSMLAFEQGLGKTITSVISSELLGIRLTYIVVPASLKHNWYEDLQKFGVEKESISILDSKNSIKAKREQFVIINYDILSKYKKEILQSKPGHIIFDECHKIKNKESQRYKVSKKIVQETGAKVTFLSGTPAPNKIIDIFSYLEMIGHPIGKSYKDFLDNYCIWTKGQYGINIQGGKNLDSLNESISNFMLRKTKKECLDLPEKSYYKVDYELDDYKAEYELALADIIEKNKGKDIDEAAMHILMKITSKAKLPSVIEFVRNHMEESQTYIDRNGVEKYCPAKISIWTYYTDVIDALKSEFGDKCVVIDGRAGSSEERMKKANRFQFDEDCQVFVGQTTAAGVGLNLTNCSNAVFLTIPFNRAELDQAIDRHHRIGQNNPVSAYLTCCGGTIDSNLYVKLLQKYKDVSVLIDSERDETVFNAEKAADLFSIDKEKSMRKAEELFGNKAEEANEAELKVEAEDEEEYYI